MTIHRRMKTEQELKALLPWYANGTLGGQEAGEVEAWLSQDAQARADLEAWRKVRAAVLSQPDRQPSAAARRSLLARISHPSESQTVRGKPAWTPAGLLGAAALTLAVLVILWAAIKPGVALQWTLGDVSQTAGDSLAAYRVYRAAQGSADFKLLYEAPARPDLRQYTYVDTLMLPGQEYSYQVEGVSAAGRVALSQTVSGSAQAALPGQMAILFTSLVVGTSTVMLLQARPGGRSLLRRRMLA